MAEGGPLLIIAAGGTAGHMFPAVALAEAMLARGWRVSLSTDARGASYAGAFPPAVEVEQVSSATFARATLMTKALVPLKILAGILGATLAMRRARPAVVVGFGGYPTIPAMAAARLLNLPRMLHEQNGVLGRVNRLFAKHVDKLACGTWPADLPEGIEGIYTGNPVRAAVKARAGAPYIAPGEYPMDVLIFGGSQGARVLSDVVPEAIAALPESLRRHLSVSQQARPEDVARVSEFYAAHGIRADIQPFFDDIARRISEAQLVISRAGASSLADISVIGRPAILIPYPHATGDHQSANARALLGAGAAFVLPEDRLTPESLAAEMTQILSQPDGALAMSQAALEVARPDATERLVELVLELAAEPQAPASSPPETASQKDRQR